MGILDAIILGIIEGLTELLPVSSTGHLILVGDALGHGGPGAKSFDVVIQLGAVVAVGVYFRKKLGATLRGLRERREGSARLVGALLAAFVPTAIVGLLLHRWVKELLFHPEPVALALVVGGVLMIGVEHWHKRRPPASLEQEVDDVGPKRGLIIGLCQCVSLWPGSSRSMTTIVGGQLTGLDTRVAAEFSFLLALPTLGAATLYDLYENGAAIFAMPSGATLLAVGMVVSFLVTWLVVAIFLRYVKRVGLTPFGLYRIVIGLVVWFAMGSADGEATSKPARSFDQPLASCQYRSSCSALADATSPCSSRARRSTSPKRSAKVRTARPAATSASTPVCRARLVSANRTSPSSASIRSASPAATASSSSASSSSTFSRGPPVSDQSKPTRAAASPIRCARASPGRLRGTPSSAPRSSRPSARRSAALIASQRAGSCSPSSNT